MKYADFVDIMSNARMGRYLNACGGDTRRAMTLYRKNLLLSQKLFSVLSCFEIALRNSINNHYLNIHGTDWLKNAAAIGGMFANQNCKFTANAIYDEAIKLGPNYSHPKLVAALGFGFWRFLFSDHQYRVGGQNLIQIFINRPQSTPSQNFNAKYFFNELVKINDLRNRMAHHEPICFIPGSPVKDTMYARQHYNLIMQLFQWMGIDAADLLYGLDHINKVCDEIDNL